MNEAAAKHRFNEAMARAQRRRAEGSQPTCVDVICLALEHLSKADALDRLVYLSRAVPADGDTLAAMRWELARDLVERS